MFTDLYPPYVGGQPIRFHELASRLAARGHEVSVLCVATDPSSPLEAVEDGVRVTRWPRDDRYDNPIIGATKRGVVSTVRYAAAVRRSLRQRDIDIAYFNQWPFLHVIAAPRRARRRSAVDWCELRSGAVYGAVQRMLPRLVAANYCVNDDLARRLSELAGVPVGYLPSGVDTARYWCEPAEKRQGLLFLGRLVDTKDLPLLVAGYAELWSRGVHLPLRVAGDGAQAADLRRMVDRLPAEARECVELLGSVSEPDKARLLAESQVLVLSSRREGFPIVVAEAMASGLPVATVDRPDNGTHHVVERFGIGATGPPTPSGLAGAIEATLHDWSTFSGRGRAAASGLDWERVTDQFIEQTRQLLVRSR